MYNPDMTNQEKLEEIYRLSVENNHLLHKMIRRDSIALALRAVYWLAILGILGGAYYYVRPLLESVTGSTAVGFFDKIQQLMDAVINLSKEAGSLQNQSFQQ